MDLQFVWGNPRSKDKKQSLASRKTSGKNNKKHGKGKSMAKRKHLKKKNPIYATYKKTDAPSKGKKQAGAVRLTSAEASELRRRLEVANNNIKKLESISPANKKKTHKALIGKYKKSIPKLESLLKTQVMSTAEFKKEKDSFKNLGYSFDKLVKNEGNFFARKKKKKKTAKKAKKGTSVATKKKPKKKAKKKTSGKKKSLKAAKRKSSKPKKSKVVSKKKTSKKKVSKKKSASKKKKSASKKTKTKSTKTKSSKRSKRGKRKKLKKTFTVAVTENPKRKRKMKKKKLNRRGFKSLRRKSNPLGGVMNKVEQALGHSMAEAGSLAIGGALYGVVNSSTAKYLPKVHQTLARVPVVGTALPTLLVGALLNYLGQRQKINALSVLGKGLVGASVVGAGVNASQMVPGLRPATLKGVDYTMEGYGEGGEADFGYGAYDSLPEGMGEGGEADFGGVDYTMEGVDYTMEGYGEGGEADFGDDGYDGEPEGMGDGQMG